MDSVLTIGGFVLGVIGLVSIPLSVALSRRSRQTPDLRVARDFDEVVPEGDWLLRGGLVITFDGKPLDRVSRTYFAIWNHRGDTVRGSEVLVADPLRVEVAEGDAVLQARVVASSRSQIGVDVTPKGRTADVTFDFMDAGDGAVIEVLHYGKEPANLVGTIPGARLSGARRATLSPNGRRRLRLSPVRRLFDGRRVVPGITLVTGVVGYALICVYYGFRLVAAGSSQPLDAQEFDLETLEGQRSFAAEVGRAGTGGPLDLTMFLVTGLTVLFAVAMISILIVRTAVPRSIVAEDTDPDPDERSGRAVRARKSLG